MRFYAKQFSQKNIDCKWFGIYYVFIGCRHRGADNGRIRPAPNLRQSTNYKSSSPLPRGQFTKVSGETLTIPRPTAQLAYPSCVVHFGTSQTHVSTLDPMLYSTFAVNLLVFHVQSFDCGRLTGSAKTR